MEEGAGTGRGASGGQPAWRHPYDIEGHPAGERESGGAGLQLGQPPPTPSAPPPKPPGSWPPRCRTRRKERCLDLCSELPPTEDLLGDREAAPLPSNLPFSPQTLLGLFLATDTSDLPTDLSPGTGGVSTPCFFVRAWVPGQLPNVSQAHPGQLRRAWVRALCPRGPVVAAPLPPLRSLLPLLSVCSLSHCFLMGLTPASTSAGPPTP